MNITKKGKGNEEITKVYEVAIRMFCFSKSSDTV